MRIGFGGIGKGYAAEKAKQLLIQNGVEGGIVNAAGDLTTWGNQPDGSPWTIGIADPDTKDYPFSYLNISNMAVATSGNYEKFAVINGKHYSHTIDPKTGGRPPRGGQGSTSGASSSSNILSNIVSVGNISSASGYDKRYYPSVNWAMKNTESGVTIGANASYSTEYDYESKGGGLNFTKTTKDGSREYGVKASAFFDTWMVIYPVELRPAGYPTGAQGRKNGISYQPRNSFSVAFSLAQIVNRRLQVSAVIEPSYQEGLLATKYQRVYFTEGSAKPENLPSSRWKLPIGLRGSYFLGDRVILRGGYRFYTDQWGITAHTANLETAIKLSPFCSISPFYRVYGQSAAKYFAPYKAHSASENYFTSDYDLSKLTTRTYGVGIRWIPEKGVWGMKQFYMMELRYAHFSRSTDLTSDIVTVNMKFK